MTDLAKIATTRRTAKAFDPTRRVDAAQIEQLKTLLRFAPSSVNSQPWHFIFAETDVGKARLADTLQGPYAYNAAKVGKASHVVVLCARRDLDDTHLAAVLAQEDADGRFATPEARATQGNARGFYVNLHREQLNDLDAWINQQVYIALGSLLLGAAALGIDACPMEGIDRVAIDNALGLADQGLRAVVLVALGYSGADDFNAKLPKSRLAEPLVLSTI